MKLIEIKEIKSKIILETGLHIGAGNDEIRIGGVDNPVVKNPVTKHPYIPGSSIKGKVRTLLEWETGQIGEDGKPLSSEKLQDTEETDKSDNVNLILRIFGNGDQKADYKGGPTRASFRDCNLKNYKELIKQGALTEDKTEVVINRRTGTAKDGGLRHIERVPAGAEFDFSVIFKIFDMEDDEGKTDEEAFKLLKKGLKMLEKDSLGGSGSRGYGKFRFEDKDFNVEPIWESKSEESENDGK
ncbi:MAG: type III-A CRISPR-associated RAMP protein Csm3 [Deltaproteobacteria bacterium]|nr:type III-A CRISPR-associated RAMP protein Csm3 [Deltaproteobacteria bacterium]